jgi:hypothetical protein
MALCSSAVLSTYAQPPAPPPALDTTPTIAGLSSMPDALGGPLVIGPAAGQSKMGFGPPPPLTAPISYSASCRPGSAGIGTG